MIIINVLNNNYALINSDKMDVLVKQTLLKSAIIDIGTQPWASIKESK